MTAPTTGVSLMWLLDGIAAIAPTDAQVLDLTLDSRAVRAGSLFFALAGQRTHGLQFAADAVRRGASVVLWDAQDPAAGVDAPLTSGTGMAAGAGTTASFAAAVPGLGKLLGRIADRFFEWPSSQLRVTGITGTNGKTTCAYLLAQCLERLNYEAAYIGTLGWGRIAALDTVSHTTPDVITVHRMLAQLRTLGIKDVVMEVSSHALDQGRVDAVRFHTAAFTNLSRDHLDYHPSMEAYAAAKARLFRMPDLAQIVINIGDPTGRELVQTLGGGVPVTAVWVGAGTSGWLAQRELHADEVTADLHGISFGIAGTFGQHRVLTQLLGRFNAENSLVVLGCLSAIGIALPDAAAALAGCHAPPGRMEVIESPAQDKPLAVIDYAHTPDALAKALRAVREHCTGSLWCVFGCGGDRDAGKRPMMGAIADELADQIIVTDDNPRSENPDLITRAIVAGITQHVPRVIHDRGAAIAAALAEARAVDVVLIAGKGHEEYQIYGAERRTFSDRREAQRYLGVAA